MDTSSIEAIDTRVCLGLFIYNLHIVKYGVVIIDVLIDSIEKPLKG